VHTAYTPVSNALSRIAITYIGHYYAGGTIPGTIMQMTQDHNRINARRLDGDNQCPFPKEHGMGYLFSTGAQVADTVTSP